MFSAAMFLILCFDFREKRLQIIFSLLKMHNVQSKEALLLRHVVDGKCFLLFKKFLFIYWHIIE